MASKLSRTILRIHIWLVATVILLPIKLLPLKRLLQLLTPTTSFGLYRSIQPEQITEMVQHRLRRPRHMRARKCLREGLTLFHFLRLAGAPAEIHIAVHTPTADSKRIRAHCWVVLDGVALTEPIRGPGTTILTYG